jgi:FtsZ-binding cell division protein ZapB
MSKQPLSINFNVIDEATLRSELEKAQAYINVLNTEIEELKTANEELKNRLDASPY